MKLYIIFICLILNFIVSASAQRLPDLNRQTYLTIKDHAKQIIDYSSKNPNVTFIFVGRSPIFLAAYLRSVEFYNFEFLPVSGIKYFKNLDEQNTAKNNFINLNWSKLYSQISDRDFALVDYVKTNATMNTLLDWIKPESKQLKAIFTFGDTILDKNNFPNWVKNIPLTSSQIFGSRFMQSYLWMVDNALIERYAPYQAWDPLTSKTSPEINENKSMGDRATFHELVNYFKRININDGQDLPSINLCETILHPRFL